MESGIDVSEPRKRAAARISAEFLEGQDLQRIQAYRIEMMRKERAVDSEIASLLAKNDARARLVVHNVKTIKHELPLIRNDTASLREAVDCGNFWQSDARISGARNMLSDTLTAKHNLLQTVDLCNKWLSVPIRVAQLIEGLKREPLLLQKVANELEDLQGWRRSLKTLVDRVDAMHDKNNRSTDADENGKDGEVIRSLNISVAKAGFEKHMGAVSALEEALNKAVLENVRHCIDIGISNPALIVMTMRVIEEKRLAAEQSDTSPISDMQQMAQAAVHEAIVTRAQDLFDRLRAGDAEMTVDQALSAASQVLQDLRTIAQDVNQCMPEEFGCVSLAKNLYQSFLLTALEPWYSSPRSIEHTVTILRLIDWLDFYNSELESIVGANPSGGAHCLEFETGANALLTEYLIRVQMQLDEWISSVEFFNLDIVPSSDGLMTSFPTDVMRLLRLQLDTAITLLKPERLLFLLQPIAVPLLQSQIQIEEELSRSDAKLRDLEKEVTEATDSGTSGAAPQDVPDTLSLERLATVGNDLVRISGHIAAYREELEIKMAKNSPDTTISHVESGVGVNEALHKFDDVSRVYLELSFKAVGMSSRSLILDLLPYINKSVGSTNWESKDGDIVVSTIIKTLEDYFNDIQKYLDTYLFPRFLRNCLDELILAYLQQLARDRPSDSSDAKKDNGESLISKNQGGKKSLTSRAIASKWRSKMNMKLTKNSNTIEKNAQEETNTTDATTELGMNRDQEGDDNAEATDGRDLNSNGSAREKLGSLLALSKVTPFASSAMAATRVQSDFETLVDFIEKTHGEVLGAAGIRNGAASYLEPISSVRKILVAQGTLEAEEHTMAFFRSFKSSFTGSATAFNRTAGNIVSTIWARKGGTMASRREFDNMSRRILFSL